MLLSSIRQHILDRAIRGQLVPQLPEEGTAEELYQQIQAEKKALIANGSIKKEKPLEPIQEEEIKFDVPTSWKWVRLGDLFTFINGDRGANYPAKSQLQNTGIPFISAINILNQTVSQKGLLCVSDEQFSRLRSGKLQSGDLVVCIRGSLGKFCFYPFQQGAIASSLVILRKFHNVYNEFIGAYLSSTIFVSQLQSYKNGTAQPNLPASALANFIIPLPPLNEQKRISEKVRELCKHFDTIKTSKIRISAIRTEMTKRILNKAIQGKLVPQRPEEGTAEELYQQILAEKQRLIAAGTIKKEKPLPPIEEKDLPFDIPETWKWVRLDNLVRKNIKRGKAPVYTEKSGVAVFSQKCNSKRDGINLSLARYLDEAKLTLYSAHDFLVPNDIVINSTGEGTLGRVGIFQETDNPNNIKIVPDGHVTIIRSATPVLPLYLYHYLKSRQSILEDACGGSTHQTELRPQFLRELLIPLPPLKEQKRIVAKIKEMLTLCKSLQ